MRREERAEERVMGGGGGSIICNFSFIYLFLFLCTGGARLEIVRRGLGDWVVTGDSKYGGSRHMLYSHLKFT